MPTCKNCNSDFKNLVLVDGKTRNLCKRKYCLNCSPFGLHNTKALDGAEVPGQCKSCSRLFEYDKKQGHSRTQCNSCLVNSRHKKIKQKCVDYLGSMCCGCGYNHQDENWCAEAMDFHHTNDKDFAIGGAYNRSWSRIQAELDKCVLLCARCHREVHAGKRAISSIGQQRLLYTEKVPSSSLGSPTMKEPMIKPLKAPSQQKNRLPAFSEDRTKTRNTATSSTAEETIT